MVFIFILLIIGLTSLLFLIDNKLLPKLKEKYKKHKELKKREKSKKEFSKKMKELEIK